MPQAISRPTMFDLPFDFGHLLGQEVMPLPYDMDITPFLHIHDGYMSMVCLASMSAIHRGSFEIFSRNRLMPRLRDVLYQPVSQP